MEEAAADSGADSGSEDKAELELGLSEFRGSASSPEPDLPAETTGFEPVRELNTP